MLGILAERPVGRRAGALTQVTTLSRSRPRLWMCVGGILAFHSIPRVGLSHCSASTVLATRASSLELIVMIVVAATYPGKFRTTSPLPPAGCVR